MDLYEKIKHEFHSLPLAFCSVVLNCAWIFALYNYHNGFVKYAVIPFQSSKSGYKRSCVQECTIGLCKRWDLESGITRKKFFCLFSWPRRWIFLICLNSQSHPSFHYAKCTAFSNGEAAMEAPSRQGSVCSWATLQLHLCRKTEYDWVLRHIRGLVWIKELHC